jgi:hypothetical protein
MAHRGPAGRERAVLLSGPGLLHGPGGRPSRDARFMVDVRARMVAWRAALAEVEREERRHAGKPPEQFSPNGLHRFISLRMGIHSIGAKVAWCDETIALLDARLAVTTKGRTQ